MAIDSLHLDHWKESLDVGSAIAKPGWSEVLTALALLDGETHTLLSLEHGSGTTLQVGGGPSRFVVQWLSDQLCWCATSASPPSEPVILAAGGQAGEYPPEVCATAQQARIAAETFFLSGARSPKLSWQRE